MEQLRNNLTIKLSTGTIPIMYSEANAFQFNNIMITYYFAIID